MEINQHVTYEMLRNPNILVLIFLNKIIILEINSNENLKMRATGRSGINVICDTSTREITPLLILYCRSQITDTSLELRHRENFIGNNFRC